MLILTRKTGETIAIGDDIKVQVLDIKGKNVRLGIKAPNVIPVHREEVFERIKEANRLAAGLAPNDLSEITNFWEERKRNSKR
ncbi:MAG: carbon storage regulator CsrA [Deltaproteobacteria bacterium]|nr:carbon storage regulator CsrA [Deltaproteobacteria bacterium]MBW2050809.1 carbon storage regulator CsrA [Deltaproteobacteria bacterium]MBW2142214.1 carbon storage regulator CsrA [Deltaproteobacteria bacterium]MBW2322676.1 carbon storage regulator CsrA [Deltaproteobacteria bacterium]